MIVTLPDTLDTFGLSAAYETCRMLVVVSAFCWAEAATHKANKQRMSTKCFISFPRLLVIFFLTWGPVADIYVRIHSVDIWALVTGT